MVMGYNVISCRHHTQPLHADICTSRFTATREDSRDSYANDECDMPFSRISSVDDMWLLV